MTVPARQSWQLPVPSSRTSSGLELARVQRDVIAETARRAANAADDYSDDAADHLGLLVLAARVPPHLRGWAEALVEANTRADLAGLARLYRPGR